MRQAMLHHALAALLLKPCREPPGGVGRFLCHLFHLKAAAPEGHAGYFSKGNGSALPHNDFNDLAKMVPHFRKMVPHNDFNDLAGVLPQTSAPLPQESNLIYEHL
jgi:hypothetical protein